ncbi:hypothetical protein DSO57_1034068 [Entomophthora muscae]|uniref:Uncharacterized protein n=1 Tax=Entomophthora muscae TaxID=34485 RepID=A0ACC2TB62_9FUNG|nr:hypothetical protein DSO57_1034068 [Entomophthora muscae]
MGCVVDESMKLLNSVLVGIVLLLARRQDARINPLVIKAVSDSLVDGVNKELKTIPLPPDEMGMLQAEITEAIAFLSQQLDYCKATESGNPAATTDDPEPISSSTDKGFSKRFNAHMKLKMDAMESKLKHKLP